MAGAERLLEIVRIIAATPEEIFDAWTDPRSMEQWMVPGPTQRTKVTADPRVGGRFAIDMHVGAAVYAHHGEYLRLERPRLLEFTWISDATEQQRTIVTIELSPKERGTELRLRHRLLPSEEAKGKHESGWGSILEKLAEQRFSAGSNGSQFTV